MNDTELYRRLLGLESPWAVERVALDMKQLQVDVFAAHEEGVAWPCPECGAALTIYDHSEERTWRHLDSMQFKTYLHARVPRVKCPEHGVHQVKVPWSEARSRFTALFERFAIQVLQEMSISGASEVLRVSWDEAHLLMRRAVTRGLKAKKREQLRHLGVDEKAVRRRHIYFTLVCNLDKATVEYVAEDRKAESLDEFFDTLTLEQRDGIEAVAVDMWRPYTFSLQRNLPDADKKVVFDKFHVMRLVQDGVNMVRKREHRALRQEGREDLTRTKHLWLTGKEKLNTDQRKRFRELQALNLKTGRAWALKESLREIWSYAQETWARKYWKRWYGWAMRSRLEPMKKAARAIAAHLDNVMTYFRHRITNAAAEGLNAKIQMVLNRACGFRNPENFKTAIYFHFGGLDLFPATHAKV